MNLEKTDLQIVLDMQRELDVNNFFMVSLLALLKDGEYNESSRWSSSKLQNLWEFAVELVKKSKLAEINTEAGGTIQK
jgi:hypothetical protein